MRLIDADALVNELRKHFGAGFDEDEWWNSTHVLIAIEWTPTVDAIPVIRCKECRHYTGKWCTIYSTKQFDINDIYKDDDDFCSQAERKEE